MNRGRTNNAGDPIERLDLQICTKKNAGSEEREEEEGMQNARSNRSIGDNEQI